MWLRWPNRWWKCLDIYTGYRFWFRFNRTHYMTQWIRIINLLLCKVNTLFQHLISLVIVAPNPFDAAVIPAAALNSISGLYIPTYTARLVFSLIRRLRLLHSGSVWFFEWFDTNHRLCEGTLLSDLSSCTPSFGVDAGHKNILCDLFSREMVQIPCIRCLIHCKYISARLKSPLQWISTWVSLQSWPCAKKTLLLARLDPKYIFDASLLVPDSPWALVTRVFDANCCNSDSNKVEVSKRPQRHHVRYSNDHDGI